MLKDYIKDRHSVVLYPEMGNFYSCNIEGIVFDIVESKNLTLEKGIYNLDRLGIKLTRGQVVACAFKPLFSSILFIENWTVVHLDRNIENVHPSNLIWVPPTGGQVCPEDNSYRVVPVNGRFAIDDAGNCFDRLHLRKAVTSSNSAGYVHLSYSNYSNKSCKLGVHTSQLLSLGGYDSTVLTLVPNHEDGVKNNNARYNLKWSTKSSNLKHAYKNRLRGGAKEVEMLDLLTMQISKFPSISALASFLETKEMKLSSFISQNPLIPYMGRYCFKFTDVPYEWPEYPKQKLQDFLDRRERLLATKMCMVRDISNGTVYVANSPKDLGKLIGFDWNTIRTAFKFQENNLSGIPRLWPFKGYEFRWGNDPLRVEGRNYSAEEIAAFSDSVKINKPLQVNWHGGEVKVYCNLFDLSKEITVPSRPTIKKLLYENGGSYDFGKFKITRLVY